MEISQEEFENYMKVHMKLKLMFFERAMSEGRHHDKIVQMDIFGKVLTVVSEYEYYPDGHDARSTFPIREEVETIINLESIIK